MADTISFEVSTELGMRIAYAVEMPEHAVMSWERLNFIWKEYGDFLRYNTHPQREIQFVMRNGIFTYLVGDSDNRFVHLDLVRTER